MSPPSFLAIFNMLARLTVKDFWKNGASLNVYYRKSATLLLIGTKPRGIEATCIVMVRGKTLCKLSFPV